MLGKSFKIASILALLALGAVGQTIPAGTRLTVRMGSEISSGTAKAGDRFDATLARPLVVNGKTIARTGAPVRGKVPPRNLVDGCTLPENSHCGLPLCG
jgi:hypothetical protein